MKRESINFSSKKEFHAEIEGGYEGIASAKIGGGLERNEEGKMQYVDENFSGFAIVTPDSSCDVTSTVAVDGVNFVTVIVQYTDANGNEKTYHLREKFKINGAIRYMVGVNEDYLNDLRPDKHIVFVEVFEDCKWRAKDACQNYYYHRKCEDCGCKVACSINCKINKKYNGKVKDNDRVIKNNFQTIVKSNPIVKSNQPNANINVAIQPDMINIGTSENQICKNGHKMPWTNTVKAFGKKERCDRCYEIRGFKEAPNESSYTCKPCNEYRCHNCAEGLTQKIQKCNKGHIMPWRTFEECGTKEYCIMLSMSKKK